MKNSRKLDQLTALRFFAAFMIVIHHGTDMFGIPKVGINWGQGVSFFFVLSGFILTYVYPSLDSLRDVRRFWVARFARVWPAYVGSFILGFLLLPYSWHTPTATAHLMMVQAWIPDSDYYFSYNAVAWSVSTEVFFYLAFPLLLLRWQRHWKQTVAWALAPLLSLMLIVNALDLPRYGNPVDASEGLWVTSHGLLYINPLAACSSLLWAWRSRDCGNWARGLAGAAQRRSWKRGR